LKFLAWIIIGLVIWWVALDFGLVPREMLGKIHVGCNRGKCLKNIGVVVIIVVIFLFFFITSTFDMMYFNLFLSSTKTPLLRWASYLSSSNGLLNSFNNNYYIGEMLCYAPNQMLKI
jgi:hypothetical protein